MATLFYVQTSVSFPVYSQVISLQQQQLFLLKEINHLSKESQAYQKAVNRFALANLPLAYRYAERWRSAKIPQEDLRQQAVLGLLEAIHLWQPGKGTYFSTYAIHRMRYQVSRFVQKKWPLVHVPQNVLADRRLVQKVIQGFQKEGKREPTLEEIQAKLPSLSAIRIELALAYQKGLQFQSLEESPHPKE